MQTLPRFHAGTLTREQADGLNSFTDAMRRLLPGQAKVAAPLSLRDDELAFMLRLDVAALQSQPATFSSTTTFTGATLLTGDVELCGCLFWCKASDTFPLSGGLGLIWSDAAGATVLGNFGLEASPPTTYGDAIDWSPPGKPVVRLTAPDAGLVLRSIDPTCTLGPDGRMLLVENVGSNLYQLSDNDASGTASMTVRTASGGTLLDVPPRFATWLQYDATSGYWREMQFFNLEFSDNTTTLYGINKVLTGSASGLVISQPSAGVVQLSTGTPSGTFTNLTVNSGTVTFTSDSINLSNSTFTAALVYLNNDTFSFPSSTTTTFNGGGVLVFQNLTLNYPSSTTLNWNGLAINVNNTTSITTSGGATLWLNGDIQTCPNSTFTTTGAVNLTGAATVTTTNVTFPNSTTFGGSGSITLTPATTVNSLTINGPLDLRASASTITTTTNNWTPTSPAPVQTLTGSSTPILTGIVPVSTSAPQYVELVNTSSTAISVTNQDTSSSANNRIITTTGGTVSIGQYDTLELQYIPSINRWVATGGSALDPAGLGGVTGVGGGGDTITSGVVTGLGAGSAGGGGKGLYYWRQVGTSPERWYLGGQGEMGVSCNSTGNATDTIVAVPFLAPRGGTLDRLGIWVNGMGGNPRVRLGIYQTTSDTNLYPGALLLDAGEITPDNVIVLFSLTISQVLTPGKLYWLAMNVTWGDGGSLTTTSIVPEGAWALLGFDATLGNSPNRPGIAWTVSSAYGALPNPYPGGGTVRDSSLSLPAIGVRFSA